MNLFRIALVAAAAAFLGGGATARADTILVFGQNGTASTIAASNNGAGTTTIFGANIPVTITAISAPTATPISAFLTVNATNIAAATSSGGGNVQQSFAGNFTITSGVGGTGTNYLSGNFSDALFGSGSGLTLTASNTPPSTDTVNFNSGVITTLNPGRAISLSFTNVIPAVTIVNGSISSFTASVAGNMSANIGQVTPPPVPEPATLAGGLIGLGCIGLARLRRRRLAAVM